MNGLQARIDSNNWLRAPLNREAVWRVDSVLPVADVAGERFTVSRFETDPAPCRFRVVPGRGYEPTDISGFLEATFADAFIVLRKGRIAYESYVPGRSSRDKHIVFSVTKSIVGSLCGILVELGKIDPEHPVTHYLPELQGSGFDGSRVRDLLDMTVSLDFQEAYLDPASLFARYRRATGWAGGDEDPTSTGMHEFLACIRKGARPHGTAFDYLSPISDVLGWVVERAAGQPLAALISELLWKPLRSELDAYITVDRLGAPRAAGGFGCTLRDMARFGECMRNGGQLHATQIIPKAWVADTIAGSNNVTWNNGTMADWMPGGGYRNQWWLTNNQNRAFFAAGIYGQWIYIDPVREVVIAKQSSRPTGPATQEEFQTELRVFQQLADMAGAGEVTAAAFRHTNLSGKSK